MLSNTNKGDESKLLLNSGKRCYFYNLTRRHTVTLKSLACSLDHMVQSTAAKLYVSNYTVIYIYISEVMVVTSILECL